jgi:hypothetical protein
LTPAGIHPIKATYNGDSNFFQSTSTILDQVVGPTTTALAANPNPANTNQDVTLTATVTPVVPGYANPPTGVVTFFDNGTQLGTGDLGSNGMATYVVVAGTFTPGTHSLTASYAGDANFMPSDTTMPTDEIVGATITAVATNPNPSSVGDPVMISAVVSASVPGGNPLIPGTVTFFDGSTNLGTFDLDNNNSASFSYTFTVGGIHPITATYNGNADYTSSTSDPVNQIVGPTTTVVVNMPSTSKVNEPVTFTATVTSDLSNSNKPSGTVTFKDGTTTFGMADVDQNTGMAVLVYDGLGAGTHSQITAVYSGDPNFAPSTSAPVTQTVFRTGTQTGLMVDLHSITYGTQVTFTATVTPDRTGSLIPGNTVSFLEGTTVIGAVPLGSDGHAVFQTSNLRTGRLSITARYDGDGNFDGSTSNAQVVVVKPIPFFALGSAHGTVLVFKPDNTLVAEFAPFGPAFDGGVTVAVGDVTSGGYDDLIVAATIGNPDVKVYKGKDFATGVFNPNNPDASLLTEFFAYATGYGIGANVAVGDIENNGYADIVTGPVIGFPANVHVYRGKDIAQGIFDPNGASLIANFFPYPQQFNVGANVAVGDVNGDGYADLVTGAASGNPDVRVYNGIDIALGRFNPDGSSLLAQWFAFDQGLGLGASVAVGDTRGNGFGDIITGATAGNPDVRIYSGKDIHDGTFDNAHPERSLIDEFFAFELGTGGVAVASADFESNGKFDILLGAASSPHYKVVHGDAGGINPPGIFEGMPGDLQDGIYVGA